MPTESFHNDIRHEFLSLINVLHDLDQGAQDSTVSALGILAVHGKQELETTVAEVASNECQQSPFIMTS